MIEFKLKRYIGDFKEVYGDTPALINIDTDEFVDLAGDLASTPFISCSGVFFMIDGVKVYESDENTSTLDGNEYYKLPSAYLMNGRLTLYNAIVLGESTNRLCSCDSLDLFHFGCKCGGR